MSRYIDEISARENFQDGLAYMGSEVKRILKKIPTADVVEVVRCKDCEYCRISIDPKTNISVQVCGYVGYNPVQSSQVTDNEYCSYGERSENGKS